MSENNGSPFRPFAKQEEPTWLQKAAIAVLFVVTTVAIVVVAIVASAVVVWAALNVVGDFGLSFWNVVGLGLLWYVADLGVRNGIRQDLKRTD